MKTSDHPTGHWDLQEHSFSLFNRIPVNIHCIFLTFTRVLTRGASFFHVEQDRCCKSGVLFLPDELLFQSIPFVNASTSDLAPSTIPVILLSLNNSATGLGVFLTSRTLLPSYFSCDVISSYFRCFGMDTKSEAIQYSPRSVSLYFLDLFSFPSWFASSVPRRSSSFSANNSPITVRSTSVKITRCES
jgi:hypothetical protein